MLRTAIAGFVGVLVGAAVVGVGVGQQEAPVAKVVRAERFEVVDAKGNVPAVLTSDETGATWLALRDEAGKPRASLNVHRDGNPVLSLSDEAGKTRVLLGVLSGGDPDLSLWDQGGTARACLGVAEEDGGAFLSLNDKSGAGRARLGARQLKTAPTGVAERRPESSLVLSDESGKVLWAAP